MSNRVFRALMILLSSILIAAPFGNLRAESYWLANFAWHQLTFVLLFSVGLAYSDKSGNVASDLKTCAIATIMYPVVLIMFAFISHAVIQNSTQFGLSTDRLPDIVEGMFIQLIFGWFPVGSHGTLASYLLVWPASLAILSCISAILAQVVRLHVFHVRTPDIGQN